MDKATAQAAYDAAHWEYMNYRPIILNPRMSNHLVNKLRTAEEALKNV